MATTNAAPIATATPSIAHLATDPLRNFKFNVNIMHPTLSGFATLGFMTVSGLNITTEVIPYREGGMNTSQPLSTKILKTDGWTTMGNLRVGDRLIDPDGEDSKVIGIYPRGIRDTYEITLADGSKTRASDEHLWVIETISHKTRKTVDTVALKNLVENNAKGVRLPKALPHNYVDTPDPDIDPYLLGVLLSEGCLTDGSVRFAQTDENTDMLSRIDNSLPDGHSLRYLGSNQWLITGPDGSPGSNKILNYLRKSGLYGRPGWEKFVPEDVKYASVNYRLGVLQGLLDGDGTIDGRRGRIKYSSASKQLRDDVRTLVFSLGGRSTTTEFDRSVYKDTHRVEYIVSSIQIELNPFHMSSKASKFRPKDNAEQRKVVSVELVGREESQCIEVSAKSHMYICDDFIVTRNTTQKMPGQSDFAPITLSQGVAVGKGPLWQWMRQLFTVMQGTGSGTPGKDFRATVDIMVLDHPVTGPKVPVKAIYRVYNAWPTAIAFSDLDAGANAVLMQQVTLAHEGFDHKLAASIGLNGVSFN